MSQTKHPDGTLVQSRPEEIEEIKRLYAELERVRQGLAQEVNAKKHELADMTRAHDAMQRERDDWRRRADLAEGKLEFIRIALAPE